MRRAAVLTVAYLLLGAAAAGLAGCGGHGDPAGPAGVAPKSWVGSVCQALIPWRGQIASLNSQAAADTATAKTPAQTRVSLDKLLSGARQASERARAAVAAAGVPDVPDGRKIADRFVASLTAVRDAYAEAQRSVDGLPTTDTKVFSDGVAAALKTLGNEYAAAGVDAAGLASEPLRKDFDEVPACNPG